MYLLRRHFGMGEREAMDEAPAWYVDMLLEGLHAEFEPDEEVN